MFLNFWKNFDTVLRWENKNFRRLLDLQPTGLPKKYWIRASFNPTPVVFHVTWRGALNSSRLLISQNALWRISRKFKRKYGSLKVVFTQNFCKMQLWEVASTLEVTLPWTYLCPTVMKYPLISYDKRLLMEASELPVLWVKIFVWANAHWQPSGPLCNKYLDLARTTWAHSGS